MATAARPAPHDSLPPPPSVVMQSCPIEAGLGTLGRKWTLLILRDIAFFPEASFTSILKRSPGLRQRTLSLRLRQLVGDGLIQKNLPSNGSRHSTYGLTTKGRDVWPVLTSLMQFGVQNHSEKVFADGLPRNIEDVYPESASLLLGHLEKYAKLAPTPPRRTRFRGPRARERRVRSPGP